VSLSPSNSPLSFFPFFLFFPSFPFFLPFFLSWGQQSLLLASRFKKPSPFREFQKISRKAGISVLFVGQLSVKSWDTPPEAFFVLGERVRIRQGLFPRAKGLFTGRARGELLCAPLLAPRAPGPQTKSWRGSVSRLRSRLCPETGPACRTGSKREATEGCPLREEKLINYRFAVDGHVVVRLVLGRVVGCERRRS
jgi:hypothetical protein